jgi:SAM-dependent methyltransferase
VSSKSPPSAEPSFDLTYSIDDFPIGDRPDSTFLFERIKRAMLDEGAVRGGRTLDVACGTGQLIAGIDGHGGTGIGIDASREMLGLAVWVHPDTQLRLARSIAETLPFAGASFDRVICQGSLDHFVDPQAFMREAARVLKPGGAIVIALANFESVACKLGRFFHRFGRIVLRQPPPESRLYWEQPLDHYHKGDTGFVRRLGDGSALRMERWYGVSMMWLVPGWDDLLNWLPPRLANGLMRALDRVAFRMPGMSDMIISVWRKR